MNAKALNELAEALFAKKKRLHHLWQEIADNFYTERADFTVVRDPGDEYAAHLMSSYPLIIRRDLGDQIGSMLRPVGIPWFKIAPTDPEREDHEARAWLEFAASVQFKAMYDPVSQFKRATKEGDHDFATFGQTVISCEINWDNKDEGPHLLHRCWHLRDVAWQEDRLGRVGNRYRKWKPTARELAAMFPGKVHPKVLRLAQDPGAKCLTEIECKHMVVEADMYDMEPAKVRGKPWISIYYDCTNRFVIDERATWSSTYVIPRWQTVSGCQYAHSPATIVALPDARLIQAMSRTLLEAGEKVANPPMVATEEVVRSDVAIYAGGLTWVDRDYDERLGPAIRPLMTDPKGLPFGAEMLNDAKSVLSMAFYLNKLRPFLPTQDPQMTAYQAGQIVAQYIRDALPLFEPMESDYNGQICEADFDLLLRGGAFGSPYDMPPTLQGARTSFSFMSPLHDAIEAQKTQKFLGMSQLLAAAVQMDPAAHAVPDVIVAFRDALAGNQVPAKWTRSEADASAILNQEQQKQQAQEMLSTLVPASQAAKNFGDANKQLAGAV